MGLFDRFRRHSITAKAGVRDSPAAVPPDVVANRPHGDRFAVIDVETTGLSANSHRIIELAVVTTDPMGRVLDEWSTRINPQGPVGATHIHGITDADVADAPLFHELTSTLNRLLAGAAIAAHNAKFDLAFLRAEYGRAGWDLPYLPSLCTLQASEYFLPTLDRRRLGDCCWALGTPLVDAHSALGDARATAALLAAFLQWAAPRPLPQYLRMPAEARAVTWPDRAVREPGMWQPTSARRPAPPARVRQALNEQRASAPPRALVEMIERFSLIDALDEGAPAGAPSYLEKLAEVLEDGVITTEEAADLASVAETAELTTDEIAMANRAFVMTLAHAALDDGKVTRAERAELQAVADALSVDKRLIPKLLDQAEAARNNRLSSGLKQLPADWSYGEPLRVGDKVVFTGCDDALRVDLEARSERLGVRVIGSVSAKTAMLVSDGTMDGTKAAKARELGTRIVHPDVYAALLTHLQPATARQARQSSKVQARPPVDVPAATATGSIALAAASPAVIRAWAIENGYDVGTRGRLHADVIQAYATAHAN